MKEKITLETWLSVFFGGIRQWISSVFSLKNRSKFWKTIALAITICVVLFTTIMVVEYVRYRIETQKKHDQWNTEQISSNISFCDDGRYSGSSYVKNLATGKTIIDKIDWIAYPEDNDSLLVYARKGKRGYFNRYTGEITIPAKYDAAWCFNDGVAGVCIGDSVFFIDHSGKPINTLKLKRTPGRSYAYHGNFLMFEKGNKEGLVDRNGRTVLPAVYDRVSLAEKNMWEIESDGRVGVIDNAGRQVIPMEYTAVYVYPVDGIVCVEPDNRKKRFDYNGNLLNNFVYDYSYTLEYNTGKQTESGDYIEERCNLAAYSSNGKEGLMDMNGHPVTPPIYSDISAFGPNLYECRINNSDETIMLNDKGRPVND